MEAAANLVPKGLVDHGVKLPRWRRLGVGNGSKLFTDARHAVKYHFVCAQVQRCLQCVEPYFSYYYRIVLKMSCCTNHLVQILTLSRRISCMSKCSQAHDHTHFVRRHFELNCQKAKRSFLFDIKLNSQNNKRKSMASISSSLSVQGIQPKRILVKCPEVSGNILRHHQV